jgi:hypothetical protein
MVMTMAAVEPHLDHRLAAQRRAVDELAVRFLLDDEAVKVARRVGHVAQERAVRRVDLEAGGRILHADVHLAGGTDRDVAVHVPEVLAPGRQLEPVRHSREVGSRHHGTEKRCRNDARERDLLHGAPSLAVVPCRTK